MVKKLLIWTIPMLIICCGCLIFFVVVPQITQKRYENTVKINELPINYELSDFKKIDNDFSYVYKNNENGYINLVYTPNSKINLQQYLLSDGVDASFTKIITTDNGMVCLYVYSKSKETVGVADMQNGLLVIKSSLEDYDVTEVIRSISIHHKG